MKNLIQFLACSCLILLLNPIQAQNTNDFKEQLSQHWVVKKGWFGEKEIVFEIKDTSLHTYGLYNVFAFDMENNIDYQLFNPQKFGMCGNGLLFINQASWEEKEDKVLRINLEGGRFLENRFQYSADYAIAEITEKNLTLSLVQEIKNEHSNYN